MNKLLFTSLIILISMLNACNLTDQGRIKKDLNTRFVKFEIVEIKKDSANIYDTFMTLLSLQVNISKGNLDMAIAENHYYDTDMKGKWSNEKTTHYMDSITHKLMDMCDHFMRLQFTKPEPCYFVKYRIYNGATKEEKEEYYYLRLYDNGKKIELMHRPYLWNDYLTDQKCKDICAKCSEKYLSFLRDIITGY